MEFGIILFMMNFCPYCGERMKSVPVVYEKASTTGLMVGVLPDGVGAGITMQIDAFGHACRPPAIYAQDFIFLVLAILALGCGSVAFLVNTFVMTLLLVIGVIFLALYIKVPRHSKKALARYEAWSRLSICENCGVIGTPNKETFHYRNLPDYLNKL